MTLQALLVSKDDPAAETLIQVLAQFEVAVVRSNDVDVAAGRLTEERFDYVIVDFDEPETASLLLESCRRLGASNCNPISVALLANAHQIRAILGAGAHFILTKPLSADKTFATFRAATAILKRERRKSMRVAAQAPVSLSTDGSNLIEGILLDVSTGGLDVLAAKPLPAGSPVRLLFELPEGPKIEADAEVAWANPNGQTGLRILDMDANLREDLEAWLRTRCDSALPDEAADMSQCKLTDLSLGGCYVETESPFPQSSAVDLCLKASDMEIHAEGLVRVMHPGHGMGIEFPARTETQRKSVGEFIEFLTNQPGAEPQLVTSPRALVASRADLDQNEAPESEADDALLELLRTGSAMEQQDFLAELSRQRTQSSAAE